ncbi:hypothetical protein QIA19_05080 (plasmid) [Borreliella finlandensis]|uniref:hypothetical protein n=1 Tax=Borreliella finlandensis TaxID=498741 RepID=UPI003AF1B647
MMARQARIEAQSALNKLKSASIKLIEINGSKKRNRNAHKTSKILFIPVILKLSKEKSI